MVSDWFLVCRAFYDWSILKKMHWECRGHLKFQPLLASTVTLPGTASFNLTLADNGHLPTWSSLPALLESLQRCLLASILTHKSSSRGDQQPDLLPLHLRPRSSVTGTPSQGSTPRWAALQRWGRNSKWHQKQEGSFWRFFFRWWTVKMSSRQPIPLITTNISWAQMKHLKLPTAKPELSCQLGVNESKIVPWHLKSSFGSNQVNLSEAEQNNSESFIIPLRKTDQWTIREADVSYKHYQGFLTSIRKAGLQQRHRGELYCGVYFSCRHIYPVAEPDLVMSLLPQLIRHRVKAAKTYHRGQLTLVAPLTNLF